MSDTVEPSNWTAWTGLPVESIRASYSLKGISLEHVPLEYSNAQLCRQAVDSSGHASDHASPGTGGLRANRSERVASSFSERTPISDPLIQAAHRAARLGNAGYDRLARYSGDAIHLGAVRAPRHVADLGTRALERAGSASVRAFDRAGQAGARVADRAMGAPAAFTMLTRHMDTLRNAAAQGIRQGILDVARMARDGMGGAAQGMRRTREDLVASVAAQAASVGAFAHSVRTSRPVAAVSSAPMVVSAQATALRRWATDITVGSVMLARMVTAPIVDKAARLGRFVSDSSLALHVGATEVARNTAGNRHVKTLAFVGAAAGLVALGSHGAADMVHSFATSHAHLPDPAAMASSAARGINSSILAEANTDAMGTDAVRVVMQRATNTASAYWSQIATAFGQSSQGHELVHAASQVHSTGAAHGLASAGGHMSTAHAASHAAQHAQGAHAAVAQFGDNTADAYNAPELARIKMGAARSVHGLSGSGIHAAAAQLPPAPVVAHMPVFANTVHAPVQMIAANDVVGTAPVVPVHAEPLAPLRAHALYSNPAPVYSQPLQPRTPMQIASSAVESVTRSLPHFDFTQITRSLSITPVQPSMNTASY